MMQIEYPYSFWSHNTSGTYTYTMQVKDDVVEVEVKMPGVEKDKVDLNYSSEKQSINIKIGNKVDHDIYLSRQIDPDKITADLKLGILTIKAPVKNTDKSIQIS